MIDRMGRKRALLGLTAIAVGALTILAPATAFAQDLGGTSVPDLNNTVGSTTGTVTGGGGSTTDTVTKPVKDTVDSTTGTGGTVGTVVGDTGDTVDKVAPGSPVGNTKKVVEETTKRTTDSVSGAVDGVTETTTGLGGTVLNPDLKVKSPLDRNRDGKVGTKERRAASQRSGSKVNAAAVAAERSEKVAAKAKNAALANLERNRRAQGSAPVVAFAPPERETFLTQLADAAVEATKKLAFPLGLALMVGAFLMVQGRIDRKDAKLALAPIDSEQDLLSFQ